MMLVYAVTAAALLQTSSTTPAPSLEGQVSRDDRSVTVRSTNQTSGVTAAYINSLTQILPTLVRGPQLEKLKSIFVTGAMIRRRNNKLDITDVEIGRYEVDAQRWTDSTYQFLKNNVSEYAAERFAFRSISPSYVYDLPGNHQEGAAQRWGHLNEGLSALLVNFDQLMRDPSIYPEAR